ncbi:hypothetical protein GPJ56_009943 [Histomonas meleagridis]|uniref:uncharacterized protein n=1 Tax=Histomonas meleagridis TaxID=135588 RepID=UPI003559E61D|nr:hypothetical protein GPJ56_009943 [Histomonas meleagridis]KAH0802750.1 hypothetical protein GO595_004257 [Histomonas meleagridis]
MCFNKEMTLGFTIASILIGIWVMSGKSIWRIEKWRRIRIASCFWYFAGMEFLQFVQYLVLDDCSNLVNIIFTALGWIHIAYQPLFSNLALSALDGRNTKKERQETWGYILKFCFVAGTLMSLRLIIPAIYNKQTQFTIPCTKSIEGMCAPRTCSYSGLYHINWTFKMLKPSYPFPSIAVHFLNMFVAPILMGQWVGSVILFCTGPLIALFFNPIEDGERSSIWCYVSIMECFITVTAQYFICRMQKKQEKVKKE